MIASSDLGMDGETQGNTGLYEAKKAKCNSILAREKGRVWTSQRG